MNTMNEHELERLISRRLDGESTADENILLDREILRNPSAARLLAEESRIDALAAEVLRPVAVGCATPGFDPLELARSTPRDVTTRSRGLRRVWWGVPAALAALVTLSLIPRDSWDSFIQHPGSPRASADLSEPPVSLTGGLPLPVRRHGGDWNRPGGVEPARGDVALSGGGGVRQAVAQPANQIKRDVALDYITVIGDDGKLYWLEVDRSRTVKGSRNVSGGSPVSEL